MLLRRPADLKVKSCDIEAWSPRQQKYFEVCSCSNLGDAQARRLKIRFRGEDGKMQLAHTLNNTCVAPPRMLIAFLENNLQSDGTVNIPEVLRPYMGGKDKLVPKQKITLCKFRNYNTNRLTALEPMEQGAPYSGSFFSFPAAPERRQV